MKMFKAISNKGKTVCMALAILSMLVLPVSVLAAVSITANVPNADENGPVNGQFTITQDNEWATDTTVNFTVTGTAANGSDYTTITTPGSISISAGDLFAFLDVTVSDDPIVEPAETIIVTLTGTSNGAILVGTPAAATVTISDDTADTGTVSIAATDATGNEAGSDNGQFTITQDIASATDTVVNFTVSGTATNGSDYTTIPVSISIPAGSLIALLDVTVLDDPIVEPVETVNVTLTGTSNGAIGVGTPAAATVTISDDTADTGTVSIAATDATGNEAGSDNGQFTITQDIASATDTVVNFTVSGTATNGSDYTTIPVSISIPAGSLNALLDVTVLDDPIVEPAETVIVALDSTDNSAITVGTADEDTVTISEDTGDTASITIEDVEGLEGQALSFTATLDNAVQDGLTVYVDFSDVSAAGGIDYENAQQLLTFSGTAGETETFTVGTVDDSAIEADETFTVALSGLVSSAPAVAIDATDTATGTITEDPSDTASVTIEDVEGFEGETLSFTATLDNEVQGGFTVNVDFNDGSATGGTEYNNASQLLTFTGTAGETVEFTVGTFEDSDIEADETFTTAFSGLVTTGGAPAGAIDDTDTATGTMVNNDYEIAVFPSTGGTVTSGAFIAPPGTQLVVSRNDTPTFVVNVDDPVCYYIDTVTVNGIAQSVDPFATVFSYPFPSVTADQTFAATFSDQYDIAVTILDQGHGTVSTSATVACGDTYTIEIASDEGYWISWVKLIELDGTETELTGAHNTKSFSYDVVNITEYQTVEVAFSQLIEIIEVSQFGDISPQGSGIPAVQLVHYGEDQSFAVTAFADPDAPLGHNGHVHHISDILVDGTSIGGIQGASLVSHGYDFTNVTQDQTIEVLFTSYVDVSIDGSGTITSDGFSLTSSTTVEDAYEVESGATASFTITPDNGYHVARMEIDGEVRGYASSWDFVDVVDEDHTLQVWFETDAFTLEPVSNFRTIFSDAALTAPAVAIAPLFQEDGTFYVKLSEPNNYDYTIAVVGLLVDNIHYTVPTAFDTAVSYPDTDPYFTLTRRMLNTPADADYTEYLEMTFTSVEHSHRLEVLDYDTTPLADVPLDTRIQPQPAVIMFVMDDSGSMDWEFMTEESDGLFGGDRFLYDTSDRLYSGVLSGDERKEWHSQWSGYNKMYYSPAVTYTPWPTFFGHDLEDCDGDVTDRVANACLDLPRSHPWHNEGDANKINMDNSWVDYSSGGSGYNTVTTINEVQSIPAANDHYTRTITVANDDSRLRVWTTFTAQNTDMMARILSSSNEYRGAEYADSWTDPYSDGNFYDDDASDRNPYIELENVPTGTYTLDFRAWDTNSGTFNLHAEVAEPQALTKNIAFAHYYAMHDEGGANEQLYLVNIKGPFDNMTDPVEYYLVKNIQVNTASERIEKADLTLITDLSIIPADVTYYPPTGGGTPHEVYVAERQNFVNWFSYYRKRELAATAAVATFIKRVDNVMVGFNTINHRIVKAPRPVQVVENMQIQNDRSDILKDLYSMVLQANGTPLRTGLRDVGRFYDTQVASSIGTSPFAANLDGDECKQVFSIVMTDGYWNGGTPGVGDADGDNWSNSLADVAQYYYDIDLAPAVANEVPDAGNDRQHMTTYTVSFGVKGNLDPDTDVPPARDSSAWYAGTNDQDKIDDLWHAAVNGRGEYFSASNPERLVASLLYIMEDIMGGRVGSAASVSVNGDEFFQTLDDTVRIFQTSYSSDYWTGDVRSYSFDIDTDGNFTGDRTLQWSAQAQLDNVLDDTASNHTTVRNIITYNPGTSDDSGTVSDKKGALFSWNSLTDEQKLLLVPYWDRDRSAEEVLSYLRGSRNYVSIGDFRERLQRIASWDHDSQQIIRGDVLEEAWLGDFTDSRPLVVDDILYAGSNNGMLHAFMATGTGGGSEVFAYIPNLVFDNLRELPDPLYEHKFFVNGGMVKYQVGNQTYLVGGLGKGGKGYFCLNSTAAATVVNEADAAALINWEYPKPVPSSKILTNTTFTFSQGTGTDGNDRIVDTANGFTVFAVDDYVKVVGTVDSTRELTNDGLYKVIGVDTNGSWLDVEAGSLAAGCGNNQAIIIRKTTSDPNMGYSYGKPVVAQSNSTTYPDIVILANGYASENGTASLIILDLVTGELIRTLDTGRGPFNGLSTPKAIDVNNNLKTDYVYAGDLRGSMWKFDLTDSNEDNWQIAYCQTPNITDHCLDISTVPEPLFTAGAHQAITAAPDIMNQQGYTGYMVIFGTGRYLGMTDLDNVDIQSVYGIWDWAPDDYDTGYLGTRIDNISVTPPVAELSNWTETDIGGHMINTLLRQELWCEGELTLDSGTGYYRVPSNYEGDWSLTPTDELNPTHPIYKEQTDTDGDGIADQYFNVPAANLGWYFDLPGKLTANTLNNNATFTCCDFEEKVDGMGQPLLDSQGEKEWQCASPISAPGGRDLGERVTSDTIIRNGRAITVSFMREGSRCSGGLYSFLNERDAHNGGMGYSPVLDVNGDGTIGQEDNPADPATDSVIDISLIATDVGKSGHLYNPVIIKDAENKQGSTEQKYMSSSRESIEVVKEKAEVEGIYFWKQIE